MEQQLSTKEELSLQLSGLIDQAVYYIYEAHPHEIKAILFTAVSLIFGYSAYIHHKNIIQVMELEMAIQKDTSTYAPVEREKL